MALQTGIAIINVTRNLAMIIIRLRLRMAGQTGKNRIRTRVLMALNTVIPGLSVFSAVNRKILPVMIKSGRFPSGVSGMTHHTINGELSGSVVRIIGLIVVGLVTAYTIR